MGKPKNADWYQVLLDMLLVPLSVERCRGLRLAGRLVFSDNIIDVPASQVNAEFKTQLREAIATLGSLTPARNVPSFQECRYCDISGSYCPESLESSQSENADDYDLF